MTGKYRLRNAILAGGLLTFGLIEPAAAEEPFRLGLPVDCAPGRTCWIFHYVDHQPGPGLRDYMCGQATYNLPDGRGHQGTDFAIRDLAAMRAGVAVIAAAPGRVKATRDGMADRALSQADTEALAGRDCGNGVLIEHGNSWSSQYCHMRKGSIAVRPDQVVEKGQRIGYVGLSGFTEFPHLHLTVRKDGEVIDPFVGQTRTERCGPGLRPLWEDGSLIPYRPTAIFNAGFSPQKPIPAKIRNGEYQQESLPVSAPALVLWAEMFNVRPGDRVTLRILGPDGEPFVEHTETLQRAQDYRTQFAGRPLRSDAWPAGDYAGFVELVRAGTPEPIREQRSITLR